MSENIKQWIAGVIILGLALMLWLPLGQYPFLIMNWMKVGTYILPFILLMLFSLPTRDCYLLANPQNASVLMLAAYLVHQFEEHWTDLLGQHYAFYKSANMLLDNLLGTQHFVEILTPEAIFVINTSLVWLLGAIAIWRSPRAIFPSLAFAGLLIVNAITHIVAAISEFSYNPGLLTALIIFVPLTCLYYANILKRLPKVRYLIFIGLIWAVLAHILLIAGMIASTWFKSIPEQLYFLLLILWSALPAIIYRKNPLPKNS